MSQCQTGFSAVLGIPQRNHILMIALRMFQPGSLWRQNGAELGSLKYENSNLSCGVLASYPQSLGCGR